MFNIPLVKLTKPLDNRGFTFIEVLIVLAIFSIGVLAIAVMQVTSISTNASARMAGEATALATNQVEAIMALPYDDSDLDPAANPHGFNQGNPTPIPCTTKRSQPSRPTTSTTRRTPPDSSASTPCA